MGLFGRKKYDAFGFDEDGFDEDGFNRHDFNKDGIHKKTGTRFNKDGFDIECFDKDGYDKDGYDQYRFDKEGYDQNGYDKDGYYRDGYDRNGYDKDGNYNGTSLQIFYDIEKKKNAYWKSTEFIDRIEINEENIRKEIEIKENLVNIWTNYYEIDVETERKRAGRLKDHDLYDEIGYSLHIRVEKKEEYLMQKIISIIQLTFPKMGFFATNLEISASASDEYQNYDEEYSRRLIKIITQRLGEEFEKLGEVKIIGTKYAPDGYDINSCHPITSAESKKAYREIGYNKDGIDQNGFTTSGIHQTTGTKYDLDGNDQHGFDKKGIHKVTKTKFDKNGFDSDGIHKVTKTKFDEEGYDKDGYWEHDEIHEITKTMFDKNGYDPYGYDKNGFDKDGTHKVTGTKFDELGFNDIGFDVDGIHKDTGTKFDKNNLDEEGYYKDAYAAWEKHHDDKDEVN
jgi:hypothetical protein